MQWVPFLLYIVVTSFTPGPNNMMSMAYSAKYGYKKSLKFILGVTVGTTIIVLLSSYFNLLLYSFIPKIKTGMSILGGLYMLYLAIKIMLNKPSGKDSNQKEMNSFFTGMILQFVNPKTILYGITTISTFVIPFYDSNASLLFFSIFLGFIGFLSTSSWAVFGALFQTFLAKYETAFHVVMGLLLMYSAVSIFIQE
ncbi:LysE family translocator [Brevibacillus sp. NRS-1366]|uniref:LysE family translocator n=1 Tax=Brevibacillus sp. NRS-1366 TaxID=3233899 RepID=UPI003D1C699F